MSPCHTIAQDEHAQHCHLLLVHLSTRKTHINTQTHTGSVLSPSFAPDSAIISACPCLSVKHFHLLWLIALSVYQLPNAPVCDHGIKRTEASSGWPGSLCYRLIKPLAEKRQQAACRWHAGDNCPNVSMKRTIHWPPLNKFISLSYHSVSVCITIDGH